MDSSFPFRALFQSKNNDMIDAFYGTIIQITSDNGGHTIWYFDANNLLKCADAAAYRITKVD
ncbi:MAG: hypothetical protein JWP27_886 [Flaviaesturariibacter sp.]|nr:hypothetical protein [Flaviaesturariibacter sp.]